jgi:hypothetical protein
MQFAKDSFYVALRDRLAVANPARTVAINGAVRPAVLVAENEPATASSLGANVFQLTWSAAQAVPGEGTAKRPLMALACEIRYGTSGTLDGGVDRGRIMAALDGELLAICSPGRTKKQDFTQTAPADLGSSVIWTKPQFKPIDTDRKTGLLLVRNAELTVFFFPEVDLP